MDLLREYGKIPWAYFESTERYHGPTSRVRKDTMDLLLEYGKNHEPSSGVLKDTMDLFLEYRKKPWTYF